tara:strand:- start:225 stop:428 length:204 start_codon:yes stop_codon:yes gene_type:complete
MEIKRLVNDKTLWDSFNEVLEDKITIAQKQLEQRTETHVMYQLQGQIAALRGLKRLRDEVNYNGGAG